MRQMQIEVWNLSECPDVLVHGMPEAANTLRDLQTAHWNHTADRLPLTRNNPDCAALRAEPHGQERLTRTQGLLCLRHRGRTRSHYCGISWKTLGNLIPQCHM